MKGLNISVSHQNNASGRSNLFNGLNNPSQGRTFSPIFGFFLLNLFAKAVAAKYASFLPYQFSYDPTSWWTYAKPTSNAPWSDEETYLETTYPGYRPTYPTYSNSYPTLTTSLPNFANKPASYVDYDDYVYPEERKYRSINKKIDEIDLTPAESNINTRRRPSSGYKRNKSPSKRNKYSQKRRRTTTTPAYYDSYEDYSTEKNINRRRRPFISNESYDDNDDDDSVEDIYYDSIENKRRRRPTRNKNKNKNKNRKDASLEEFDVRDAPQTEIVIFRQAMTTTEPTTVVTNGTTTTESSTTTTTPASNTTNNSTSYGYGPSNGNEGISITYGPPTGQYQYSAPYVNWFSTGGNRNSIVKRVRDVVNLERKYLLKK